MRILIASIGLCCLAHQQPTLSSVTFSAGYARQKFAPFSNYSAPAIGATYAYRLRPLLAIEAGVTAAIHLATEIRRANYDIVLDDYFIWVPFGLRGTLPLKHDRFELSLAAGGLYGKYYVANPEPAVGLESRSGWGGYAGGGASMAVDPKRHFWLGASALEYVSNSKYARDRWFAFTGDMGFRF